MVDLEELLAPSEVARRLGVSVQRVRQLLDRGQLPSRRSSLGRLIERADAERLAQERAARRAGTAS